MEVTLLGIDLAKNVFQLNGEDADGQVIQPVWHDSCRHSGAEPAGERLNL